MPAAALLRALLLFVLAPAALHAQGGDALPIPRGVLRLEARAAFVQWSSRFGEAGADEPLGGPFALRLSPDTFEPLGSTQAELTRFFRATDARTGTRDVPEEVTLGTASPSAAAERTDLPFFLELGLTRRIALGVGVTAARERVELQRASLVGGGVGLNPNPAANRQALAALDPAFGDLGGARFLPDSTSVLGQELLRRANLLAGGDARLQLPGAPLRANAGLGTDSLAFGQLAGDRRWRAGSASAGVRLQLLGAADTLSPTRVRSALLLRTALPLRGAAEPAAPLAPLPKGATPELSAELRADVVVSERLWLSGGARFTRRWSGSVEVRISDADDPLAAGVSRALRVDPGDGWEADVAPRFQLTESIALGGVLAFAARGADAFGEGVSEPDALLASALRGDRRATLLAVGGRFTTVPAWRRGSRILPLEAELLFHRTLSGRGGVPRTNGVEAMARVYQRLWGGRPSAAPAAMEPPAR